MFFFGVLLILALPTFVIEDKGRPIMLSLSRQARCRLFSYKEIEKATRYFDDANVIGKGGEGEVYKGIIPDGRNKIFVAVKRLKSNSSSEFKKEIDMLSNLHHANLVSLIGYCQQHDSTILVYELMPNGSLHDKLFRQVGGCSLSWDQRLNICIGAAHGLEYLHTGTSNESKIIHRDVKPANILLDNNLAAKISDFGLSRRGPANQTRSEVSTAVKGTVGYFAPEYLKTGQITTRVDVYAFGMVLFEVLCRKKPWERLRDDSNTEDQSIGQWAYGNIDRFLAGAISRSCLELFIDIAEKCVNLDPSQRPSMTKVVSVLEDAFKLQKRDLQAGKSAMFQKYSKSGVVYESSKSTMFGKTSEQDSRSNKATEHENVSQQDDIGTTESTKSIKTSQERAFGSNYQPTKKDGTLQESNIRSTESSKFGKTSKEMKPKVETRACKSLPMSQNVEIQEDVANCGEATITGSRNSKAGSSSTPGSSLPASTEGKVVLYSSMQTYTDSHKIRLYLSIYKVDIEERDPTKDEGYELELSRFFSKTQRQYCLPQLFVGGKHVGGALEVDQLYCSGALKQLLSVVY